MTVRSTLCTAFAVVVALLPALWPAPARAQTPALHDVLSLQVSASTEVTRDVLNLVLSTTRDGADPRSVQAELTKALDEALAEARKLAKPGQVDVSTGNFSLHPRYAPKGGGITHWQGTAELRIDGRDVQAIAALAGRIKTLTVARVAYSLSREAREQVEGQVAAEAIARFRAKAESYAKHFGYSNVSVREVNVNSHEAAPFAPVAMREMRSAASADQPLPTEAGKASVTATVNGSVQMK